MADGSQEVVHRVSVNEPQAQFLSLPHKFKAFVGGFGSGKTWAGSYGLCRTFYEHPQINLGYFAPTYPHIRDIFYPTIEEVAFNWALNVRIHESNKETHVYQGKRYMGTIICRSMEKPATIVGFKIGRAVVDEVDVMPIRKAQQAWRKIIARLRLSKPGLLNGVDVTTTPEGFNFVYNQFVKEVRGNEEMEAMYGLVQASTYDNEINLPEDYIPSLRKSYPPQLIEAYLNGQFVNLTVGTVYSKFDRHLNGARETVRKGEPLMIGMDFNVGKMAAIVHVIRNGLPVAVDELVDVYDTPDMIQKIKERYYDYQGEVYRYPSIVSVYPDASGDSRKSVNASATDIQLLKAAGFKVKAPKANPPVKDRVNAMNAMFCNAENERRYRVNVKTCPTYVECLEQQPWTEQGEPDKTNGFDHPPDAAGYFIYKEFPIVKPRFTSSEFSV